MLAAVTVLLSAAPASAQEPVTFGESDAESIALLHAY
jgi:hypothetical protein